MEAIMSLSVGASASAIASQLLASLFSRIGGSQTASSNIVSPAPTDSSSSSNALTGSTKPSLSDDILSSLMQLQQSQASTTNAAAGNFHIPAKPVVGGTHPQPSSGPSASSAPASNEMMRAFGRVDTSNSTAAAASPDDEATDDTADFADSSEGNSAVMQTASRATFGG
ncbi:MAG TPA: hypothetical protein VH000_04935 [Rhizomicrobium sp.]|nr:hypothetical protein [Rhizomicrobium sp.]